MSAGDVPHGDLCFGEFKLDVKCGSLLRGDTAVKLRPQSYAVLRYLVEHRGRLVSKQELLDAVWGRKIVTEDSLTHCLMDIRRALDDKSQQIIRTVPRRGYIFEAPVISSSGLAASVAEGTPSSATSTPATAHGLRKTDRRWRTGVLVAALAVIAALGWVLGTNGAKVPSAGRQAPVGEPAISIAVLPFVDMSRNGDQEYFADGLSEELIHLLALSPDLRVIARTSSFSFKGQPVDIAVIAKRLNVSHVLEGSVRKSGNKVRVTAQLVDASDSRHLWSRTFDRELGQVLALQEEIAGEVADVLHVSLGSRLSRANGPAGTPGVYDQFLVARFFYNRYGPGDMRRAAEHYGRVLRGDPGYAPAWAGLAGVYARLIADREIDPEVGRSAADEAALRALSLDPGLAEAHARVARYYYWRHEQSKAEEHLRKARQVEPNNALVLAVSAGYAARQGRTGEAIELQRQAAKVDPLAPTNRLNLAAYLLADGRLQAAEQELRALLEMYAIPHAELMLANALILQGRHDEALELVERAPDSEDTQAARAMIRSAQGREEEAAVAMRLLMSTQGTAAALRLADVHAYRGEVDAAFEVLANTAEVIEGDEQFSAERIELSQFRWSPFLRPLRDDPRWQPLMAKTH